MIPTWQEQQQLHDPEHDFAQEKWMQDEIDALRAVLGAAGERVVAYADKIAFESAMRAGKGCDVWPAAGDYEQRTGRKLIALHAAGERVDAPDHTEDMMRMVRRWSEGLESDNSLRAYFKLFNQE